MVKIEVFEQKTNVFIEDGNPTVEVLNHKSNTIEVDGGFTQNIYYGSESIIDDVTPSTDTVYSSAKTEDLLGEKVGDQSLNLTLFFENILSQGTLP